MNQDELIGWLSLHRSPGIGPRACATLLERFGGSAAIYAAPRAELAAVLGAESAALAAVCAGPDRAAVAPDLAWLAEPRHHVVTLADPDYPALLREIADAPAVLFLAGDRGLLASPQLAIVGSRNPTPVGQENARAFAAHLGHAGLTITSGLALGIDAAAHTGALAAGAPTVAVAGTGLDRVYPAAHRPLAHRIVEHGLLVSEFPVGTPPRAENFPRRNRIMSGLALGVLVVEAAVRSGSLITARLAGEQGREVFAIPGSIHSPLAHGCHALIRQGAKLVETAADVLEELGPLARLVQQQAEKTRDSAPVTLDPAFRQVLEQMGHEPVTLDGLVRRSGLTADVVSSMLLQMELRGLVAACPGGTYVRTS